VEIGVGESMGISSIVASVYGVEVAVMVFGRRG
jgi:hypothetical protein